MTNALFSRNNEFMRGVAGLMLAILTIVAVYANIPAGLAHAAGLDPVTATGYAEDSSKSTLGVGDQFIVALNYQQSVNDLIVDTGSPCTINGKNVGSSFQNFGDGTFQLVYTVAAGDSNVTSGSIPFTCSFKEVEAGTTNLTGNSGTLSSYTIAHPVTINAGGTTGGGDTTGGNTTGGDNTGGNTTGGDNTGGNTTGGDNTGGNTTGGDNTGGNTTGGDNTNTGGTTASISNATVTANPSSGTLHAGDTLQINIVQLDHMTDLTMADGFCKINNVEVNALINNGDGTYRINHIYTQNDANIAAGQLTFTCNLKNAAGQSAVLHFTDNNTVAIDTQPDGGNNGLPPAGTFQVVAEPHSGTVGVGSTVIVRVNDSGGVTDFAVDPNGTCTVNGKDVKNTFQSFGDHTYQMVYTVAAGDQNVAAGQLSVSCAVKNPAGVTGSIHAFTDNNTVEINAGGSNNTGGNTTGGNNTGGNNTGNNNTGNTNNGGTNSTTDGTINGDVQGGQTNNGVLKVDSIDQTRTTAVADGTIENGWKWIFHVTVPSNETMVQLKFGNWMHSNNVNMISPIQNMRFSSAQAVNPNPIYITNNDTYSQSLTLSGDLDPTAPGKQVDIVVEMGVPVGSVNGAYTTTYGIKSTSI